MAAIPGGIDGTSIDGAAALAAAIWRARFDDSKKICATAPIRGFGRGIAFLFVATSLHCAALTGTGRMELGVGGGEAAKEVDTRC
jgi:hypothetical protein